MSIKSKNQIENPTFYPNNAIQFTFGDLYQVESRLESYELRNISRIVNVLGGQYTELLQEHEEITEEDDYSEFEKDTTEESSLTTSTTESMETAANKQQNKENAFSVSTGAKATYGVVQMQVDASYDNKNGSSSSKSNAQSYAKSVVESSRKSVRTRILTQHRKNTQIRDLERKSMGLDNRGGENFVGIYRHISEVHEAKLIKHQKHLFAKIYIPTPSENYSKHISGVLTASTESPAGLKFTKGDEKKALTFANLTDDDWMDNHWIELAAEFGIEDPIPFPIMKSQIEQYDLTITETTKSTGLEEQYKSGDVSFTAPKGYIPIGVKISSVGAANNWTDGTHGIYITLPGRDRIKLTFAKTKFYNFEIENSEPLTYLDKLNFKIPVVSGWYYGMHITFEMQYKASEQMLGMWRLNFYNQILEAAEGKPTPEDKLGLSRRVNVLANADAAKKLIKEELERETMQYVLGTDLKGFDGYWRNLSDETPEENYPEVNVDKTNSLQPIVSFLSTAFDFDKMSYRFLPAYLGAEENRSKLFDGKNSGEIREFLQAGWAEVILPIRRGEEYKFFYMLETGLIWAGSDEEAPLPNSREYLALSEEIEEDRLLTEDTQADSNVVDVWTFNLPTPFEILQDGSSLNDEPVASSGTLTSSDAPLGG